MHRALHGTKVIDSEILAKVSQDVVPIGPPPGMVSVDAMCQVRTNKQKGKIEILTHCLEIFLSYPVVFYSNIR